MQDLLTSPHPPSGKDLSWHEYFMRQVYLLSLKSKDDSTKIGALTVTTDHQILTTGYNGICRGVLDPIDHPNREDLQDRLVAPNKYLYFEHAERNSVFSAAREGIKIKDSLLYTQALPCTDCARSIIQAGIKTVYVHKQHVDHWNSIQGKAGKNWTQDQQVSIQMLTEAKINLIFLDMELGIHTLIKKQLFKV